MKRIVVIGLIAIVVVAGVLALARRRPAAEPAPILPPVKAPPEVVAEARVVPVRGASLSFTIGGVASEIAVAQGDRVAAGQTLVRLASARQAAARTAQAEASLVRAQARLAELRAGARSEEIVAARAAADAAKQREQQAEVALRLAESDLHRAEQLYADGVVSRSQADQARMNYDTALANLDVARAEVRRAEAQLELTEEGARPETLAAASAELAVAAAALNEAAAAQAETELRSPFGGVVAAVEIKRGEFVSPGVPVIRLADTSAWLIETTDLTELGVARVHEGARASVTFDALPELKLSGTVIGVRTHGENRLGDIVYTVTIRPERHDPHLYWNMTATVAITPTGEEPQQ